MLCKLFAGHGFCCKMQLCQCQENLTRTAELYLGIIRVTLIDGKCVLTTIPYAFECEWLILKTATYPIIRGRAHFKNIIYLFFFFNCNVQVIGHIKGIFLHHKDLACVDFL